MIPKEQPKITKILIINQKSGNLILKKSLLEISRHSNPPCLRVVFGRIGVVGGIGDGMNMYLLESVIVNWFSLSEDTSLGR